MTGAKGGGVRSDSRQDKDGNNSEIERCNSSRLTENNWSKSLQLVRFPENSLVSYLTDPVTLLLLILIVGALLLGGFALFGRRG